MRRIKRVEVEGLFGLFKHTVNLRLDEHITIISSPNGYGKTALLRMIAGLLSGDLLLFYQIPFERFAITFDDDVQVVLNRQSTAVNSESLGRRRSIASNGLLRVTRVELRITASTEQNAFELPVLDVVQSSIPNKMDIEFIDTQAGAAQIIANELSRPGANAFTGVVAGYLLFHPRANSKVISSPISAAILEQRIGSELPSWLRTLLSSVQARLILTQRLESIRADNGKSNDSRSPDDRAQPIPTVISYSQELAKYIRQLLATHGARSQELDRTFPIRLLNRNQQPLPVSVLRDKLAELEQKRNRLTTLGFLDPEHETELPSSEAVAEQRNALSIYVRDVEQKLAVFDETAAKIELFLKIVNSRFLYKSMSIHREEGFVFTSAKGERIHPAELSSGEQHTLILLYELLFKAHPGSLILIDEPEISMHLAWQERFLDELQAMVKLSGFDAIIATHSSEIVGSHWDLVEELTGPELPEAPPAAEQPA